MQKFWKISLTGLWVMGLGCPMVFAETTTDPAASPTAISRPVHMSFGVGFSSNAYSIDGVSVSPAAFSYAAGLDMNIRESSPFGLRLGLNYTHATPRNQALEEFQIHELILTAMPSYQLDVDSTRISLAAGPSYGYYINKNPDVAGINGTLTDGIHLGLELRASFGPKKRFFACGKHFVPLYEGSQVRPTLIMAGINL